MSLAPRRQKASTNSLGELATTIADDPEVRDAIKAMAIAAINEATDLLETGSPPIKMQMIRMVVPAMAKGLTQSDTDNDDELKAAVAALNQSVRDAYGDE